MDAKKIICNQLYELEKMSDPMLPRGVNIHCFEMQKKGRGWKTLSYEQHRNGNLCNYSGTKTAILNNHTTLSCIKKDFFDVSNNNLYVVLDGNMSAPSQIFQIVIECRTTDEKNNVSDILQHNKGLNFEVLECEWVDHLTCEQIKKLKMY